MRTIPMPMAERLFIGVYPCGLVYADRGREESHDFVRLAFLSYSKLTLEWDKVTCPPELKKEIETDAMGMMARRGYSFPTSATGSSVILGGDELMVVTDTDPLPCPKCGKPTFRDNRNLRERTAQCFNCSFHFLTKKP